MFSSMMELSKDEIKQEVINASKALQAVIEGYKDMDRDDILHNVKKAQLALARVTHDVLDK